MYTWWEHVWGPLPAGRSKLHGSHPEYHTAASDTREHTSWQLSRWSADSGTGPSEQQHSPAGWSALEKTLERDMGNTRLIHVCDRIWENLTFCIFHQNWDFAIFSIYNVWIIYKFAKYQHLQFYHQWATALCNAAITIANIEGSKLACAHTQNITFFKMLDFRRSGHICTYYAWHIDCQSGLTLHCMDSRAILLTYIHVRKFWDYWGKREQATPVKVKVWKYIYAHFCTFWFPGIHVALHYMQMYTHWCLQ